MTSTVLITIEIARVERRVDSAGTPTEGILLTAIIVLAEAAGLLVVPGDPMVPEGERGVGMYPNRPACALPHASAGNPGHATLHEDNDVVWLGA